MYVIRRSGRITLYYTDSHLGPPGSMSGSEMVIPSVTGVIGYGTLSMKLYKQFLLLF